MRDEKVIEAIRRGDEEAIGQVMDKYSRLLWSIAGAVLHDASPQDVEECVADVFIYLWQNPDKYDPQRGGLKVWLSILARSRALDKYRALSRRNDAPLEEALLAQRAGLADGLLAQEDRKALCRAVQALEEPDREVLLRRYYHEQKPREIALALDMPVKQVENRLYRAKRKLRSMLDGETGGV